MGAAPTTTVPPKVSFHQEVCDVCDGPTFEMRCKIICTRCGYTRDCADP